MPYKDPEKRKEYDVARQRDVYCKPIAIRFRKDTEESMYESLVKAAGDAGLAPATYTKTAVIEKLTRDGYLPEVE